VKKKFLITTYHEAFAIKGGGEYELFYLVDTMRECGLVADVYGPYSRDIDNYDIIIHFSVHESGLELLKFIKSKNKKIILWPNLWFNKSNEISKNVVKNFIDIVDFIVFKSDAEFNKFSEILQVPLNKCIKYNLIADKYYTIESSKNLFNQLYGIKDYALWMGIIEPSKNQLAAIEPLKKKNIPLVFVGKYRDEQYYNLCKRIGGQNVFFIDYIARKSEIARSAFQNALFYIELSLEPAGISSIEAGLSGCRVILSDTAWSYEHFANHAVYVDPNSASSIENGIDKVLNQPKKNIELQKSLLKYCEPNSILELIKLTK